MEAIKRQAAASARLCVETHNEYEVKQKCKQPPPRGCVLKQQDNLDIQFLELAAASARLCVET